MQALRGGRVSYCVQLSHRSIARRLPSGGEPSDGDGLKDQ
ncbi:hypothetical protein FHY31_004191 [Xanthomonas euvesicatoria]|uniref:Uncharacterized protein n=1 Tax=Xanthomonas euvesicatoria TaxID=456327 RepID=A0AAW3UAR8_XANEU|nr:hypothetical protein [Xanthomonas euvesicatoria]MBB4872377.1 hypothetical protein [Xanthomonas euvesicatoria]